MDRVQLEIPSRFRRILLSTLIWQFLAVYYRHGFRRIKAAAIYSDSQPASLPFPVDRRDSGV